MYLKVIWTTPKSLKYTRSREGRYTNSYVILEIAIQKQKNNNKIAKTETSLR